MMKYLFFSILFLLILNGCAGGNNLITFSGNGIDENPSGLLPVGATDKFSDGSLVDNIGVLGLFNLSINYADISADLTPIRKAALTDVLEIVDVSNFLRLSPCTDCAKIKSVALNDSNNIVVRIGIKHPFGVGDPTKPVSGRNRADLHVFNVEGAVVSDLDGDSFPTLGEKTAGFKLVNADGYSGYLDSSLEKIFPTPATIHPYILHFDDYSQGNFDPANPMGFQSVTIPPPSGNLVMAMGSDYHYQDYIFNLPNGPINFIYVTSCTYGVSSASISQRFHPEYRVPQYNKKAASEVSVNIITNALVEGESASKAKLEIHVVDINHNVRVGPELDQMLADSSVRGITIEVPGIENSPVIVNVSSPSGGGHDPSDPLIFPATITNSAEGNEGTYPGLVKVIDNYPTGLNELLLLNNMDGIERVAPSESPLSGLFEIAEFATYQVFSIDVVVSNGWARTWGGASTDIGYSAVAYGSGNIYVTGCFEGTAYFDPETTGDPHTSNGESDIFLSKFDCSGNFLWAKTWGGIYVDNGRGVALDSSGNIYVTGEFEGTVDFNPDDGIENHSSVSACDPFLSKFDCNGVFQWARTWGSTDPDYSWGCGVDNAGRIYVAGSFRLKPDFDPGSAVVEETSKGSWDVFLSCFDSSGIFNWVRTWGGTGNDASRGMAVDSSGYALVTGFFANEVDFNPDDVGIDNHTSNGMGDAFLSRFDSAGNFLWAKTWGGTLYEQGRAASVDGLGNIEVTGWFADIVDFDPSTAGTDEHTSLGADDAFLSKFSSSGNFIWARTWGGANFDTGYGVAGDSSGNIYVAGRFWGDVDFDPSLSEDIRSTNENYDAFMSKFDPSGSFLWVRTWGGNDVALSDVGYGLTMDGLERVYVTGNFDGTSVDFDPGLPEDLHTTNGGLDVFLGKFKPDGYW